MAWAEVIGGARKAVTWWQGELSACLPARVRQAFAPRPDRLILRAGPSSVVATIFVQGEAGEPLDLGPVSDLTREQVTARLPQAALAFPRILVLEPGLGLRQQADLPLAAEATVRDVVGFEMDRLTPFAPGDVYYDARVAARRPHDGKLTAEFVLAPRDRLDPVLTALREAGLAPDSVDFTGSDFAGLEPEAGLGFDMLSQAGRRAGWSFGGRVFAGLASCAILLAVAGVGIALERQHRAAVAVEGAVAALNQETRGQSDLRARIDALKSRLATVSNLKAGKPLAVEVLEAITALLPDDSYLENLRLADRRVEIAGRSAQATALIGLFEASALFEDVRFREPVVQAGPSGEESFSIAMVLSTPNGKPSDGPSDAEGAP